MGQIGFQVGLPKAGSAARSAEAEPRTRSLSSLAGSAARAAEGGRLTEKSGFSSGPTISMRAAGGKVFQPHDLLRASAVSSEVDAPPAAAASPTIVLPEQDSATGPGAEEENLNVSAMTQAEDLSQSGHLQTAASRIHSLVQSLFGGRTRTP